MILAGLVALGCSATDSQNSATAEDRPTGAKTPDAAAPTDAPDAAPPGPPDAARADAPDAAATDAERTGAPEAGRTDATDAVAPDASAPPAPLSILFVGNSYTSVNNLPGRVEALLLGQRPPVDATTAAETVGGAFLAVHAEAEKLPRALTAGPFDYVVLQAQSLEPLAWPEWFEPAAEEVSALVEAAGAEVLYYATWARAAGDTVYDEPWSGGSPEAMSRGLEDAYRRAAQVTGGVVVPVGRAFTLAGAQAPDLGLYAADGSHPSPAGTYLAACVFATVLLSHAPDAVGMPPGLDSDAAERLRDVAAQAVSDFTAE